MRHETGMGERGPWPPSLIANTLMQPQYILVCIFPPLSIAFSKQNLFYNPQTINEVRPLVQRYPDVIILQNCRQKVAAFSDLKMRGMEPGILCMQSTCSPSKLLTLPVVIKRGN